MLQRAAEAFQRVLKAFQRVLRLSKYATGGNPIDLDEVRGRRARRAPVLPHDVIPFALRVPPDRIPSIAPVHDADALRPRVVLL